jgi:hypothetical protein
MSNPFASVKINPFDDDVVTEPRDVSYSVKGLNEEPLAKLLVQFGRLADGDLPRTPVRSSKAQLVVSPDRGYGKSHLLGKLFSSLGDRATQIYLRPFQDSQKAWHSILLLTVQELERPDHLGVKSELQLEAFATGVVTHVAADFLAEGGIHDYQEAPAAVAFLRTNPLGAIEFAENNKPWLDWLKLLLEDPTQLPKLAGLLKKRGIDLLGREQAWLKILSAYAFSQRYSVEREAALKWIRAEPLEAEEISLLKLLAADNEGRGDATAQDINGLSFKRLRGLCSLSSYYRPFLFCFDQTEFYTSDKSLITALGNCIDKLYAEVPNQLTVITANSGTWLKDILPHLEAPYRDRLSPEILLEGIRLGGAKDLISKRLGDFQLTSEATTAFFSEQWLETVYKPLPEIGVRALLSRAAERFRVLAKPSTAPKPKPSLLDLFKSHVNEVHSKQALQQYNQDTLMWFAQSFIEGYMGVTVTKPNHKYFSTQWIWPDRSIFFAYEGGDNCARWRGIANEAIALNKREQKKTLNTYVLRTPDLTKVPRPTWKAIKPIVDEATSKGFQILSLTLDEVCELHAARE